MDDATYEKYNMEYSYCPKNKSAVIIQGFFVSDYVRFAHFSIKFCDSTNSPVPCKTQAEIDTFMTMMGSHSLVVRFVVLDTQFNPLSEVPVKYSVNENLIWLPFSKSLAAQAIVRIGEWEINSDTNFLPWE